MRSSGGSALTCAASPRPAPRRSTYPRPCASRSTNSASHSSTTKTRARRARQATGRTAPGPTRNGRRLSRGWRDGDVAHRRLRRAGAVQPRSNPRPHPQRRRRSGSRHGRGCHQRATGRRRRRRARRSVCSSWARTAPTLSWTAPPRTPCPACGGITWGRCNATRFVASRRSSRCGSRSTAPRSARRSRGTRPTPKCSCKSTSPTTHTAAELRSSAVPALVRDLHQDGLRVRGLMAVGPHGGADAARPGFHAVVAQADELGLPIRSLGMSDDLEVAIACGSTMVRVGAALFGARPQSTRPRHLN